MSETAPVGVYAEVANEHHEAIESARRAVVGGWAFPSQKALVAIDEAMRSANA